MKKIVIFDIDKTIYDGNLYEDIIFHLISKNLINPRILPITTKEFLEYTFSLESYEELISELLENFKKEFPKGISKELKNEIILFIRQNTKKIRDFAFEIPRMFPEFDYLIISLEPDFVANEVGNILGIPNVISNHFDFSINGRQKFHVDKFEMLKKSVFTEREIFASFGDSELDYTILLSSQNKFVFNPSNNMQNLISGNQDFKVITPESATENFHKATLMKY
jgi:phosphoserine phosphatase